MDFMTAVKTVLIEKYCCFNGRARRSEFWYFSLFTAILGIILMFNDYASAAFSLATLLPSIGVSVRRMHDVGKSGCLSASFLSQVSTSSTSASSTLSLVPTSMAGIQRKSKCNQ